MTDSRSPGGAGDPPRPEASREGSLDAPFRHPLGWRDPDFHDLAKVLWAHVRRGKNKRNVKIGKLKGACKTLDVKRKLFPADAKDGLYTVHFDTKRKYSKKTSPQVSFQVVVFHTFKPASASSVGVRWIQID